MGCPKEKGHILYKHVFHISFHRELKFWPRLLLPFLALHRSLFSNPAFAPHAQQVPMNLQDNQLLPLYEQRNLNYLLWKRTRMQNGLLG